MKRAVALAIAFAFVMFLITPVFAIPEPISKLKVGVTEVIKSPLELPKHTTDEVKSSDFKPFGLMGGLVKGTYHMAKNAVHGAIDIVTFPLKSK